MQNLKQLATALLNDEEGQAMVEYPLIIAMVSVAAIAALALLGPEINAAFMKAVDEL